MATAQITYTDAAADRAQALAMQAQYMAADAILQPLRDRVDALDAQRRAIQPRFIRNSGRGYYAPLAKAATAKRAKLEAAIDAIRASAEWDQAVGLLNQAAAYLQAYKAAYHGDAWYTGAL